MTKDQYKQVADVTLVSRIFHPGFQTFSPATSTVVPFRGLSNDAATRFQGSGMRNDRAGNKNGRLDFPGFPGLSTWYSGCPTSHCYPRPVLPGVKRLTLLFTETT